MHIKFEEAISNPRFIANDPEECYNWKLHIWLKWSVC